MANVYTPTDSVFQQYRRSHQLVIDNPLHGNPALTYQEEEIFVHPDGREFHNPQPGMRFEYDPAVNANFEITLIDPATNQPTGGTITAAAVYQALYSLYFQLATTRDAAP